MLCAACLVKGYCKELRTPIVSDEELSKPEFLLDVRRTAFAFGFNPSEWRDQLYDWYCAYAGCIVDSEGREVFLDLEVLEVPLIRGWFRDWACTLPRDGAVPRVRIEARERIRVLATILRASFPELAYTWGLCAANDNAVQSSERASQE